MYNLLIKFQMKIPFMFWNPLEGIVRELSMLLYRSAVWPFYIILSNIESVSLIIRQSPSKFYEMFVDLLAKTNWQFLVIFLMAFFGILFVLFTIIKITSQSDKMQVGEAIRKIVVGIAVAAIIPTITTLGITLTLSLGDIIAKYLNFSDFNTITAQIWTGAGGQVLTEGDKGIWVDITTWIEGGYGDYGSFIKEATRYASSAQHVDAYLGMNFIFSWVGCGFIAYYLIVLSIGLLGRIFEIIVLTALSPFFALTYMIDGGTRLKTLIGLMNVKLVTIIGMNISFFFFIIAMQMISTMAFDTGPNSIFAGMKANIGEEYVIRIFIMSLGILAAGRLIATINNTLSQMIGEASTANEAISEAQASKHTAGAIKTGLGAALVGKRMQQNAMAGAGDSSSGAGGSTRSVAGRSLIGGMGMKGKSLAKGVANTNMGRAAGGAMRDLGRGLKLSGKGAKAAGKGVRLVASKDYREYNKSEKAEKAQYLADKARLGMD